MFIYCIDLIFQVNKNNLINLINEKRIGSGKDKSTSLKGAADGLEVNTTLVATQKILSTIKNIKYIYKSILNYKSVRTQFKNILNDFTKTKSKSVPHSVLWSTASKVCCIIIITEVHSKSNSFCLYD